MLEGSGKSVHSRRPPVEKCTKQRCVPVSPIAHSQCGALLLRDCDVRRLVGPRVRDDDDARFFR
jgi:hypothetical protein